ncbi:hypothetical protein ACULL3_13560 [Xanthomonas arboricola pv. corylina]|uniref:hypothetical protein n=1 Tax=Xanthomonas TaxID=338 RepID=UPI0025A07E65|nr:hypothetical protein [Xanthomonas campestris]MDM7876032.1 hypothetical protein [Xanthomonas campestris pv. campestris]
MVSELMPVAGVGLIDSDGNKVPIKFWSFIDKRLWLLFISAATLSSVIFYLLGRLEFLRHEELFKKGLAAFKEDAISLLVTFGSVMLVIFLRKLLRWEFDLTALLGVVLNYILAFLVFNSTIQDELH